MARRRSQRVALAAVVLVIAGCQADDDARHGPDGSATPTCNHAPDTGGGDGGLGAGFGYDEDAHHAFDTAASITLCMNVSDGLVRFTGSTPQITVAPETRPGGPESRFTFAVTVSPGATGGIDVQLLDDEGKVGIGFHGPNIETDSTGWMFGPFRRS